MVVLNTIDNKVVNISFSTFKECSDWLKVYFKENTPQEIED